MVWTESPEVNKQLTVSLTFCLGNCVFYEPGCYSIITIGHDILLHRNDLKTFVFESNYKYRPKEIPELHSICIAISHKWNLSLSYLLSFYSGKLKKQAIILLSVDTSVS